MSTHAHSHMYLTLSRVAGAVAFGRMLAYAALRLPTTSTGTYGTGVHVHVQYPVGSYEQGHAL